MHYRTIPLPRTINTICDAGPIQAYAAACIATRRGMTTATAARFEAILKRFPVRVCYRGRKFCVGQPDDGLPRRHGRRGRRSHPRELEPRKRDVASAQREPTGTLLAGWDEASSASTRAASFPSSSAHGRTSSTATATAATSRGLHAAVLLVSGGS